ncbi:MAG: 5-formyltetrahydrofolate cyclo-ligase [Firmicutes bacterium]|nr:5-formyltetrahydrofolate cyclo-ligase [Bacillota bacterium]
MERREQQRRELRTQMRARRESLSPGEVDRWSQSITRKLLDLEPLRRARRIMGFARIDNEVDLGTWLTAQSAEGKTVLLPRLEKDATMAAVPFRGWSSTLPGAFGILEPIGVPAALEEIEAVIVPGLVFDASGYRLGYGKGYYDRFLRHLRPDAFICGVCYEFQVVDDICPHAGDVPVHWIVTEKSELLINGDFF